MAGSARDIDLDIVGHNKTGRATSAAARNLDQLKRKVDDVNKSNNKIGVSSQKSMKTMVKAFTDGAATLRAGGPYLVIAALAASLVALPTIAAAAGMGIVLGVGGGLAALGIKAASSNKKVQAAFSQTKKHVVSELKEMAKPFEPVLIRIAQRASKTFDSFRPALERSFKAMAPAIDRFSVQFFKSLEKLKPAIKPVTDEFIRLLNQIGPRLPGIMKTVSNALIDVADALRKNPEAISRVISSFENMIKITGKVIAWLIRMNQTVALIGSYFQWAAADAKVQLQSIVAKMADMVADVAEAGARLPGPLGKSFRKMAADARTNANQANASLQSLKTDKSRAQIEVLQARIRQLKGKKVVTEADRAEIARSQARIRQLQGSINALRGKEVRVGTVFYQKGKAPGSFGNGLGVLLAAGTDWVPNAGATSRVGGPTPVTIGDTNVDARVYIGNDMIKPMVRTIVREGTDRQAHRARIGRR